jgi:bifunctional non-homologous end joining protein LigD
MAQVKVHQEEEFVIGGFTAPAGARKHLGALPLGAYRGKDFIFVGKVGTADLAKATLYTYFDDKNQIAKELAFTIRLERSRPKWNCWLTTV